MVQLDNNHFLLELFHGPTLAFKDFAMQLIGQLFQVALNRRGDRVTIVGATSGDTAAPRSGRSRSGCGGCVHPLPTRGACQRYSAADDLTNQSMFTPWRLMAPLMIANPA